MAQATATRDVIRTAKNRTVTIADLGRAIGEQARMELEASEWAHKAFVKGNEKTKKDMRTQFVIGFVAGKGRITSEVAESVVAQKRGDRQKNHQLLVMAAYQKFKYHVSRDGAKSKAPKTTKPPRVRTEFKTAAIAFIEQFYQEANAAAIGEVIKQLQAFKKQVK